MGADAASGARAAVEAAASNAYGKLVAILTRLGGDLAAAEDALADAFAKALEVWPRSGTPDRPEAWLLTTARRRLTDLARKAAVRARAEPELAVLIARTEQTAESGALPDERLALMLACADPLVDPALHTPLMLQAVMGLDAARIGSAFLTSPAAMGQRLARGKATLRAAGLRYEAPAPADLPARLGPVLQAIYAAYSAGFDLIGEDAAKARDLSGEALFLARLVAQLAPEAAEARALHALIAHCEARAPARRSPAGEFIPLTQQDPALWDAALVDEAESALRCALALAPPGRFALEAAIQSVHAERRRLGATNWRAAAALYDALILTGAGLGAHIARACAHGEAFGPQAALDLLQALQAGTDHQPYFAACAHWLAAAGRAPEARAAYARAAALSADPALRAFLQGRAAQL
ncbi:MAG: RNA polymerase subunit sigma-70 [Alphaproteobacteria bacterium]|nr:RNA polymerase subunit sigma-70 [Alphaproteobacteria bacterium]